MNLNKLKERIKNCVFKYIKFKDKLTHYTNFEKKQNTSKIFSNNINNKKFSYLKTKHSWHIVDPSPWPICVSFGTFFMALGAVLYMNKYINGEKLFLSGLSLVFLTLYAWFRDIIREATFEDQHNFAVQKGIKLGMLLFIVSEIMFFFSFFWSFFHASLSPTFYIGGVWPPEAIQVIKFSGVPLTNTCLLLTSGATLTWSHHALKARSKNYSLISILLTLLLAIMFTFLQGYEYVNAPFNINDSVYGSCFYMITGFHGFHVIIGTCLLFVCFFRLVLNHFTNTHHVGFECSIWYWHFVDGVWLLLFIVIYWWSNL